MVVKNITGAVDSWMEYDIRMVLDANKEEEIRLVLTSNGGNVAKAIAISDLLRQHGNVTVEFSGVAASSATWLAYGAKHVAMHNDTLWLCHQSSCPVIAWEDMNAEELDAYIKKLENEKKSLEVIDAIIAKKYLDRCSKKGKNLKDVVDLMKEERYLAPADVLEWGFVDEIIDSATASNVINPIILNSLGLPKADMQPASVVADEESLINRIVDRVKAIFAKKSEHKKDDEEKDLKNKIINIMNKTFSFVNALLKIEGVEENEGKIALTNEQLKAINDELGKTKNAQDAVQNAEAALDKISDKIAGMTGIENKIAALSLIFDHMPVGSVVSTSKAGEQSDEKNVVDIEEADEVNEFVKRIK